MFWRNLLRDLVTLRKPVTAGAVVALAVQVVSPFGLDVGPWGARLTAVLVGVGVVAAYVERLRGRPDLGEDKDPRSVADPSEWGHSATQE